MQEGEAMILSLEEFDESAMALSEGSESTKHGFGGSNVDPYFVTLP